MLKYYVSDILVGLSSDTKITTIEDGARFYETDTRKEYLKINGAWVELTGVLSNVSTLFPIYREDYLSPYAINTGTTIGIPNSRTYVTGTNRLDVYVEGIFQRKGSTNDYQELNNTGIYLNYAIPSGTNISFVVYS